MNTVYYCRYICTKSIICSISYALYYFTVYHNYKLVVEFEILTAVNVKSDIIWNVYGIAPQRYE
jgi:hypothetical protein